MRRCLFDGSLLLADPLSPLLRCNATHTRVTEVMRVSQKCRYSVLVRMFLFTHFTASVFQAGNTNAFPCLLQMLLAYFAMI